MNLKPEKIIVCGNPIIFVCLMYDNTLKFFTSVSKLNNNSHTKFSKGEKVSCIRS